MGIRERAQIVALAEIWDDSKRDLHFVGYKRWVSRHMGMRKGMAPWMHAECRAHMSSVHDDEWIFAFLTNLTAHTLLVVVVHMPQPKEPHQHAPCLDTITTLPELYTCALCKACGDWNRFVAEHAATAQWMQERRLYAHCTHRDLQSDKDWLATL